MDWFFDGIGTMLIGLIIGGVGGGAVGWKIGVNSRSQRQSAKDHASQVQIMGDGSSVPGKGQG